jgi:hypothetical protein
MLEILITAENSSVLIKIQVSLTDFHTVPMKLVLSF